MSTIEKSAFLITGGAGFIGSNLVESLLNKGAGIVRVLDNLSTGNKKNIEPFTGHPSFEFMGGDIRDIEICRKACKGIDYVSHQAALGSVPRSIKDPVLTHEVNSSGFIHMLQAAKEASVKRFVYASSSSVYGSSPVLPKQEEQIGEPLSPYAITKYNNEQYAKVFGHIYGIQTIGLRYFNIFGPRQDPEGAYAAVIPKFILAVIRGEAPFIDGDGEQTRDFTFVENAVQANQNAFFVQNPEAMNEVYNIALGESYSVNQLFRLLCGFEQKELSPVYRTSREGDIRNSLADISKARKLLDYDPKVRFEEGLKKTWEWLRASV